ncbi:transposase, mutator type, partial [Mesorhizobium amorphae CCNWGS0123]
QDLISTVTDAVLDEVATWQQRPLDPIYPLVFFGKRCAKPPFPKSS